MRDASGRDYPGVTGRYRFPFAAAGTYRLRIGPPGDYIAPSAADPAALASLRTPTSDPFIINPGSFGGEIRLVDVPIFSDIPLDRPRAAALLLTKTAAVRQASPGDVVRYDLRVTSRSATTVRAVSVRDWLPRGLRYRKGSMRGAGEPEMTADGRTLAFPVASLGPNASATVSYLVDVEPGAPVGEALNRAQATGDGVNSNEAAASVRLQALLTTDAFTVIGRVTEGRCGNPVDGRKGVAGIRLLLEDGTFTVTDRDGLYHFEGVRPGHHVVQLDTNSLAATHAPVACDSDTRQAGNATSRFVEAGGGLLKRMDFQLAPTGRERSCSTRCQSHRWTTPPLRACATG